MSVPFEFLDFLCVLKFWDASFGVAWWDLTPSRKNTCAPFTLDDVEGKTLSGYGGEEKAEFFAAR